MVSNSCKGIRWALVPRWYQKIWYPILVRASGGHWCPDGIKKYGIQNSCKGIRRALVPRWYQKIWYPILGKAAGGHRCPLWYQEIWYPIPLWAPVP